MPAKIEDETKPASAPQSAGTVLKVPGFMKTGDAAQEELAREEARRAAARESYGRLWRFFIGADDLGKPFRLTFLDGVINPKTKLLGNPTWKEHTLKMPNGKFDNYVCTDHGGPGAEPCPICHTSNDKPAVVMGFTVIDHRPVSYTKGDMAGKTVPYTRKLFIAKPKTIAKLQLKAAKFGGLRGICMDVSRSSSTEASVGDNFELDSQWSEDELQKAYGVDAVPADWAFELNYKNAEELVKLGVANAIQGIKAAEPSVDYTEGA